MRSTCIMIFYFPLDTLGGVLGTSATVQAVQPRVLHNRHSQPQLGARVVVAGQLRSGLCHWDVRLGSDCVAFRPVKLSSRTHGCLLSQRFFKECRNMQQYGRL